MNKNKIIVILALTLIIGGIIAGGVMVYRGSQGKTPVSIKKNPSPTPTQIPKPTEAPTPTPVKKVDLSKYKIQVLNGSGVVGAAGEIKTLLEKEGAKSVATDNADSYDNKNTEIRFKKEVKEEVFIKLKEILSNYTVVKKDTLSTSSDYDIVIIIGTKK